MKKLTVYLFIFLAFINTLQADAKSDMPALKLDGKTFYLQYSEKSSESHGYVNEYFKSNETYTRWTELVGVHHFPNTFSPIEQANLFKNTLTGIDCPNALKIDEENNSAVIDFLMIEDKKLPILLEFNIFKFQKDVQCGTIALQYVQRYQIANALEIDKVKKEVVKNRKKFLKKIEKMEMPILITSDVENGKYVTYTTPESGCEFNLDLP